ncbi:MAG: DUF3786 domain-containing protein [Desulfobacterales bacterium]|nr:DUF3786 domain-containing protein [Desulfobacterales bacterium]
MIVIPQLKSNDISDNQLIPEIKRMQGKLGKIPKAQLIENSGVIEESGRLYIDVFFKRYEIDPDNFDIIDATGDPLYVMLKSIILTYLTMSDGVLPSGNLISFRELPDGSNYCHAFQGYAPDRLSNFFNEDIHRLHQVCLKIGGSPINLADLSYKFDVFPRIKIVIAYFIGEDSFPSRASLLFDSNVDHYMVTAGAASIGYQLVDIIIKNSSL